MKKQKPVKKPGNTWSRPDRVGPLAALMMAMKEEDCMTLTKEWARKFTLACFVFSTVVFAALYFLKVAGIL